MSVALGALLLVPAARAATFVVTRTTDDNGGCDPTDCALREAVIAANALPGPDVIEVPKGVYTLTIQGPADTTSMVGDLDVAGDLEIHGAPGGGTIIQGDGSDHVMSILGNPGASTHLLADLTITGGSTTGTGGGLWIQYSNLTILRTTITGNFALVSGGGVRIYGADVHFVDSALVGNSTPESGGGGYLIGLQNRPCKVTFERSTISGNNASWGGGFLRSGSVSLKVIDSTIADNSGFPGSATFDEFADPTVVFERSIIKGDCGGTNGAFPSSAGHNFESPYDSCGLHEPTDRVNVADLGLGPLADNGGPTLTHALLPGSPAIDAAGTECGALDQRGFGRPRDGDGDGDFLCDAGAYEAFAQGGPIDVPGLGEVGRLALVMLLAITGLAALKRVS